MSNQYAVQGKHGAAANLLKEAFILFDYDGNECIDVHEFHDVLVSIGLDISIINTLRLVCDIKRLDFETAQTMNPSEITINFEEFLSLLNSNEDFDSRSDLREAFSVLDFNRDGAVDIDELKAVFATLLPQFPYAQIDELLADLENSGHRSLDFQMFCDIFWKDKNDDGQVMY